MPAAAAATSPTGLSEIAAVPWSELHDVPTAIVTGSNGKTTTVSSAGRVCPRARLAERLLLHRRSVLDGQLPWAETIPVRRRAGSYASGAPRAAVIEIARGGILRRGLAISRARVAVVTNVGADHFGEYGIDDLAGLADVKLTVGGVVG